MRTSEYVDLLLRSALEQEKEPCREVLGMALFLYDRRLGSGLGCGDADLNSVALQGDGGVDGVCVGTDHRHGLGGRGGYVDLAGCTGSGGSGGGGGGDGDEGGVEGGRHRDGCDDGVG